MTWFEIPCIKEIPKLFIVNIHNSQGKLLTTYKILLTESLTHFNQLYIKHQSGIGWDNPSGSSTTVG